MGCNCGQGGNQQAQREEANAVAESRRASVAQKPRQIPERLRRYYEVPPPGEDTTTKEH